MFCIHAAHLSPDARFEAPNSRNFAVTGNDITASRYEGVGTPHSLIVAHETYRT